MTQSGCTALNKDLRLIYIDIPGKLLDNFSSTLSGVGGKTGKRENGTSVRGQQRRTGGTADNTPIKKHVNGRELSIHKLG